MYILILTLILGDGYGTFVGVTTVETRSKSYCITTGDKWLKDLDIANTKHRAISFSKKDKKFHTNKSFYTCI